MYACRPSGNLSHWTISPHSFISRYTEYISRYTRTSFPIIVYLEIYDYERKLWHPSWAQFMTFSIMLEHVLRHPQWLFFVWWSQKWKNSVKKKYSGNSVHLGIYAHVLSISKHIHLILCKIFVMPSIDFLLFINALMRLLSTVHCMLEPNMTKR